MLITYSRLTRSIGSSTPNTWAPSSIPATTVSTRSSAVRTMLGSCWSDVDLQLLSEISHATPTDAVLGCIRHCGLFSCEPEHTMAELLCEGRRKKLKDTAEEKSYVAAYLKFQRRTRWAEPDEALALKRLKLPPLIAAAYK